MDKLNLLFVCTGNTCRSPMAEALARHVFESGGMDGEYHSAGVSVLGASPASPHAIHAMQAEGLDLSAHRSQAVCAVLVRQATWVLAMTRRHKETLAALFPDMTQKIFTLAECAGRQDDIPDPFGMDFAQYLACAQKIKQLIILCAEKIQSE